MSLIQEGIKKGVADLRYESSFVGFLKTRLKLTFGYDAQLPFLPWFSNAEKAKQEVEAMILGDD